MASKSKKRDLEDMLAKQIQDAGLPAPEREYMFAKEAMSRMWRADFAWPSYKLIVEVEGGTWTGGRHTTGLGFREDAIKYNSAILLGWRVMRATSDMIRDKTAITHITMALEGWNVKAA